MKIDKRKKFHLVVDVETAGGLDNPLVYDLGFAIVDKKGTVYESRSFLIKEIWNRKNLMNSAYYSEKIPMYEKGIVKGDFVVVDWKKAISEMNRIALKYQVQVISAYNLAFDKNALVNTNKFLGYTTKILDSRLKGIKELCIWGLACETIFKQKTYGIVATREKWLTPAGNYKTTAEMAYRYITGDYDFEESHTGLDDVKIESKIMAQCYRQNKTISKGIIPHPWRIPNK